MGDSQISSCNSLAQPLCGSGESRTDKSGKGQAQQVLRTSVLEALGVKNAGGGLRGIAAALREVLANVDPNAPDPVAGLLETINTSLDTAAKKLADQGVDQATIDSAIKRFRAGLARELDALAPASTPAAPAPATDQPTKAVAIHQVVREKLSLDILTAEGDKVSIRFRSKEVSDVAAAQTTGATAAEASFTSRGGIKIEVTGDLNDAELTAIGDLLDEVDAIAKDFFAGDIQAAFSAAARIGFESDALSGFNLKLSYSQRIGFASTYGAASSAQAPSTPAATAPNSASPAKLASTKPDPTTLPAATSRAAEPVADVPAPTPSVDEAPALPTNPAPSTPAPSAQQTIMSFAKSVLAKLAAVSDGGSAQFSIRWKVDFLLTALTAVNPAPEAVASTEVLGNALKSEAGAAS